jgi:anaerobic selenocysteine-containing dehydrogenase
MGPYGVWGGRLFRKDGLSLRALKAAPHGIALGNLTQQLPERLFTPDKKIHAYPDSIKQGLETMWHASNSDQDRSPADRPGLDRSKHHPNGVSNTMERNTPTTPRSLPGTGIYPNKPILNLWLIGRRHLRSNNSWMHNLPVLAGGRDQCTAMLHPQDAAQLSIEAGEWITVQATEHHVTLPVELSSHIRPGVISIPHGWGHDAHPTMQLKLAQAKPGQNANKLTSDAHVDALCGNAIFNGVSVQVYKA